MKRVLVSLIVFSISVTLFWVVEVGRNKHFGAGAVVPTNLDEVAKTG